MPFSDIDECVQNTHNCSKTSAFCNNTEGSFSCTCKPGFTGDGHNCTGTLVSRGRPFSGANIVVTFQPSPQSFSALSNLDPTRGSPRDFGEQGNISQFLGTGEPNSKNYSTKTFWKCVGTWEHRAILEGNKGTRTPPGRPSPMSRDVNERDSPRTPSKYCQIQYAGICSQITTTTARSSPCRTPSQTLSGQRGKRELGTRLVTFQRNCCAASAGKWNT